jgi:hypothetical protein
MIDRMRRDQRGLSTLERLGVASVIVVVLAFVPPVRETAGDWYNSFIWENTLRRGILITIVALVSFVGTGYLVLYTNLGARLAFLVTGAAVFGWLAIGGTLFVVYAPRGLRPASLEGLNAFQIRIPAIALTLGSLILFLMFVVALDRYERSAGESA